MFSVVSLSSLALYHSWLNKSVTVGPGCLLVSREDVSDPHHSLAIQTGASGLNHGDLILSVPRVSAIDSEYVAQCY